MFEKRDIGYKINPFNADEFIFNTHPNKLNEEERQQIAEQLVADIKEFPNYKITNSEFDDIVAKLDKLSSGMIIIGNTIYQNQTGIKLIDSFHPHMWNVKCQKFKTAQEIFDNKKAYIRAIAKYIKVTMHSEVFTYQARLTACQTSSGAQAVSNFLPSVAKYIYDTYGKRGKILDPCMGYGGRMLGAWCSHIKQYVGVDPCSPTIEGNRKLRAKLIERELLSKFNEIDDRPQIAIYQLPFEEFTTDEKFDLVFTSPPYFNTEKYSDEDTQSWKRYTSLDSWYEKFLKVLIEKSYNYLKDDGTMILNVLPAMQDKTIEFAGKIFNNEPEIKNMALSLLPVRANQTTRAEKTEPVIIYSKNGIQSKISVPKRLRFI